MTRPFQMNLGVPSSMPGLTEASGISVARQYDQPEQLETFKVTDLHFIEKTQQYDFRQCSEFLMKLSLYMSLVETTSTTGLHALIDRVLWGECLLVFIHLLQSATRANDPCPLQATNTLTDLMDITPPNYAKLLERLAIDLDAVERDTKLDLAPYIPLLQSVAGDLLSV